MFFFPNKGLLDIRGQGLELQKNSQYTSTPIKQKFTLPTHTQFTCNYSISILLLCKGLKGLDFLHKKQGYKAETCLRFSVLNIWSCTMNNARVLMMSEWRKEWAVPTLIQHLKLLLPSWDGNSITEQTRDLAESRHTRKPYEPVTCAHSRMIGSPSVHSQQREHKVLWSFSMKVNVYRLCPSNYVSRL